MSYYSNELKEEAKQLAEEIGVKKAAEQLDIPSQTLSKWRSPLEQRKKAIKMMSEEELRNEVLELDRKISELEKANDVLRDVLGYFESKRIIESRMK